MLGEPRQGQHSTDGSTERQTWQSLRFSAKVEADCYSEHTGLERNHTVTLLYTSGEGEFQFA